MNRLLKFLHRYQNQRRIHTWAPFWTVVKMAWAQSGRTISCDSSVVCHEVIDIENIDTSKVTVGEFMSLNFNCNHEYEYSNGIRKCLKCGKENRYYLEV